ncbi:posttranslational modification protein, partial [Candidatus Magnetoovum chiemensis]
MIYDWNTDRLLNQSSIISGRVKLVDMPESRSVDIDSELDFKLVELLMTEENKN